MIEGIAEATASLLKLFFGVLIDRTGHAKKMGGRRLCPRGAVAAAVVLRDELANRACTALRFADRVGKGLRTSPRDALLAATVDGNRRGLAFGLHRAMDMPAR